MPQAQDVTRQLRADLDAALEGSGGLEVAITRCFGQVGELVRLSVGAARRVHRPHVELAALLTEKTEALRHTGRNEALRYEEILARPAESIRRTPHPPPKSTRAPCSQGARLYTGPMFTEYRRRLRDILASLGSDAPAAGSAADDDEQRFATTIHVVNGAVRKLSRLVDCSKSRGVPGVQLPRAWVEDHQDGARGGVENGFMLCRWLATPCEPAPSDPDVRKTP